MRFKDVVKMTEEQARDNLERIRWPLGAVCSHCGSKAVTKLNNKASSGRKKREGLYKCRTCRKQFTVTTKTIFESSHISIKTWLMAFSFICAAKKSVSAHQLHRMLGVTYKTAWFMCHRIREVMKFEPLRSALAGTIEADETFIGGKISNQKKLKGKPKDFNKTAVIALVERNGRVRTKVTRYVTAKNVNDFIYCNVSRDATLNTDESRVYNQPNRYVEKHETVNHSLDEYSRGDVTTNHVENFFSLLKRGINGSFHHVSPWQLQRYCDEFSFRYSLRKAEDADRTIAALSRSEGKRLYYKQPIKKVA